jgi:NADH:quinone reductase (non-electrogenic)
MQNRLLTFVVVGGGFPGVETAGEINDFIHDSAKDHYHNVDSKNIRIIIVQSGSRLLPEMSEKLGKFALQKLRNSGVEVILNRLVIEATQDRIKLNDDTIILTNTIIWSAGVAPSMLTSNLTCDHDDKTRKIIVDNYLEVPKYHGVYAIGDCALVMDPNTGNPMSIRLFYFLVFLVSNNFDDVSVNEPEKTSLTNHGDTKTSREISKDEK